MKKILILGAGYYYRPVITRLRQAGFHVLAVDRDPAAPGAVFAHEFSPINLTDRKAVLAYARQKAIDGIMPVNDFGTRTSAYVCQEMGLIGLSPAAAGAANDKGVMRDVWSRDGLEIPQYAVVSSLEELKTALEEIGFPAVLKPTDCGGAGRGISVLASDGDIKWAYDFAKPYVENDRFIIEKFIPGIELTVETLSLDGKVHVLAMSDKEKPELRTRVATSLNYPAAISPQMEERVRDLVCQAVLSIGILNGMAHTEVMLADTGPVLIEIGARGGGGHVFHTCIEAVSGICAPVEFANLITGGTVRLPELEKKGCCYRFFNPPHGLLQAVRNVDIARKFPGVLDIGIIKKAGDEVGNLKNSLFRAGYVVTCGRDRKEAMGIADQIESLVEFDVIPCPNTLPPILGMRGNP